TGTGGRDDGGGTGDGEQGDHSAGGSHTCSIKINRGVAPGISPHQDPSALPESMNSGHLSRRSQPLRP
ncbi:hypothetical protein ACFQ07_04780, partial [Actinomadura adrarensis]